MPAAMSADIADSSDGRSSEAWLVCHCGKAKDAEDVNLVAVGRWAHLVRAASRLAFRRRERGLLGGWLSQVRKRGQLAIEDLR